MKLRRDTVILFGVFLLRLALIPFIIVGVPIVAFIQILTMTPSILNPLVDGYLSVNISIDD